MLDKDKAEKISLDFLISTFSFLEPASVLHKLVASPSASLASYLFYYSYVLPGMTTPGWLLSASQSRVCHIPHDREEPPSALGLAVCSGGVVGEDWLLVLVASDVP
ncbi:unnamed protein product [Diplocarpon coronariae]